MYLSTVEAAQDITDRYQTLNIKQHEVGVRRLITPAKRIILSNVCLSIPHDILETEILKIGFSKVSPMPFLRARLPGNEYAHILSFRRQNYVTPNDDISLPPSLVITFEDTTYRVFLNNTFPLQNPRTCCQALSKSSTKLVQLL